MWVLFRCSQQPNSPSKIRTITQQQWLARQNARHTTVTLKQHLQPTGRHPTIILPQCTALSAVLPHLRCPACASIALSRLHDAPPGAVAAATHSPHQQQLLQACQGPAHTHDSQCKKCNPVMEELSHSTTLILKIRLQHSLAGSLLYG